VKRRVALFLACFGLASCVSAPPRLTLTPVGFDQLAGWQDDDVSQAIPAFLKSCAALAKLDPAAPLGIAGSAAAWRAPCAAAARLAADAQDVRAFFVANFLPYAAGNNGARAGLFTGYYEPELRGARVRGGVFQTPLLHRPAALADASSQPLPTRAEIERGALDREHLAFLWVDDPVDAYFLAVQGSGHVRLPDGTVVQLGYDGQNGFPYVAIGRLLVERGVLSDDEVSLDTISAWIHAHPEAGAALMDENPSYVFFRETQGDGPLGTEGVALTPGRSLAVDRSFVPLGVPLWLDVADPHGRLRRLVVAQDTGGAIRGPVRGDLFWGAGAEARARAGAMRAQGGYTLLLPQSVVPP
jgi:membrane-bound lytic murein transglycosylase A